MVSEIGNTDNGILIVEDHPLFRVGLGRVLASHGFQNVREAGTAAEALEVMDSFHPAYVLLDYELPDMKGPDSIKKIRSKNHAALIIVLSAYEEHEYLVRAYRAGACGYLTKKASAESIAEVLLSAEKDSFYIDESLPAEAVTLFEEFKDSKLPASLDVLTPREKEILTLIVNGKSLGEMAEALSISRKTVENHRRQAMCKLELETEFDLIRFASKQGLLNLLED